MTWGEFARNVLYGGYCLLSFVAAAVGGVIMGTGATLACCLIPLGRVGRSSVDGLDEPTRVFELPPGSDPAVPDYWHGPARADLAYVRQLAREHFRISGDRWRGRIREWSTPREDSVHTPGAAPAYGFGAGLVVGVVPGALLAVALHVVHIAVVAVLTVLWRACGLLLRGTDSALLRARNIRMRCVACFRRIPYPAYRCGYCEETHWDVRPGPLGIVRRTCRCGERLPTLLMLGSRRLDARCAFRGCGAELPHGPGALPELVIPVFGAPGAGKTRLMYALVAALQHAGRHRSGVSVDYPDEASERRFADAQRHLDPTTSTEATPPAPQRGQTLRLRTGRRTRFLQLFDAAGEAYLSEARSAELLYLEGGRTFVLVIDPLSVKGFWDGLPVDERDRLEPLRPRDGAPLAELVYQQTAEQILQMRGTPARSRLAVVLSRADQLGTAGGGELEQWVRELGLGGLLRAARLDFKEVRLFRTAAVSRDGKVDTSITDLLTWLLSVADLARAARDDPVEEAA